MKYPKPNITMLKNLHIDISDNSLTCDPCAEGLGSCLNIWQVGGSLETRKGLETDTSRILFSPQYSGGNSYNYSVTDIEITAEEETKKMISEEIDYDISAHFLLTHLLNPDGTVWRSAQMGFFRTSSETFYRPQKWVFFKGKPQTGSGIFAIVNLVNCENNAQSYGRIFELSANYTSWTEITNAYIPTVYINGRGNNYEAAKATNQAFEGSPKYLEKLNILNSGFYAYYSTDGRSSVFRLPFSGLDNNTVICRLYYSATQYTEWLIGEDETSAAAMLYGVSVTLNIDRQTGIAAFKVPAGDYEMPLISDRNENNLRFYAHKSGEIKINDITASNLSLLANKKILLAGGSTVFAADYNNPLYFPQDSTLCIDDRDIPLTALAYLSGDIIAFKEKSTYTVSVKNGNPLNSTSLLTDNDSVFYENDTLAFKCISKKTGSPHKESVIPFENRIFWRGNDGGFYTLSSNKITSVSDGINDYISANFNPRSKTIAFRGYGANIFLLEGGALVMQKDHNNPKWYYWQFPQNIRFDGVIDGGVKPILLCYNTDNGICFLSELSSECDKFITGSNYNPQVESLPVKTFIRTNPLPLGCRNRLKNISAVMLSLKASKAKISLNDRLEAELTPNENPDEYRHIRLTPGLCTASNINISLESKSPLTLCDIDIQYTVLGV